MNECDGQYDRICKEEFAAIHSKLDRIDVAIRGNSKPGIHLRLDRLEVTEKSRAKFIWIIVGASVMLVVTEIWQQVFGG